jgi:hypothetical protein
LCVVPFRHFSGLAGGVALAVIATPIMVRTTEDMINLVPNAMREAASALGLRARSSFVGSPSGGSVRHRHRRAARRRARDRRDGAAHLHRARQFGQTHALKDVSPPLHEGKVTAFIGASGAARMTGETRRASRADRIPFARISPGESRPLPVTPRRHREGRGGQTAAAL